MSEIDKALADPRCWVGERRLPNEWWRVKAYTNGHELVVCGAPDQDDESHNCDEMGCGSVGDHVLHRVSFETTTSPEAESHDQGRPVRPHRSGGGQVLPRLFDAPEDGS